jgi:RNA polymerase sigma-70 factor (ECF subfamily)
VSAEIAKRFNPPASEGGEVSFRERPGSRYNPVSDAENRSVPMTEQTPDKQTPPSRLEEISTEWGLLAQAHQEGEEARAARNALVLRYARAIRNYVGALMREPQDADEVAQEVLVRLLRGQFAAATPERGRFRRMLAVAAHNLVRNYWQRQRRQAGVDLDMQAVADEETSPAADAEAAATWRQSVLDLAWRSLEEFERAHPGNIAWTVLRLRADFPEADSEELARRLSERAGRFFRATAMRQQLRRARKRFAEMLLDEVRRTLDDPTPEQIQEELIEVGLMEYVQDFLPEDWRSRPAG